MTCAIVRFGRASWLSAVFLVLLFALGSEVSAELVSEFSATSLVEPTCVRQRWYHGCYARTLYHPYQRQRLPKTTTALEVATFDPKNFDPSDAISDLGQLRVLETHWAVGQRFLDAVRKAPHIDTWIMGALPEAVVDYGTFRGHSIKRLAVDVAAHKERDLEQRRCLLKLLRASPDLEELSLWNFELDASVIGAICELRSLRRLDIWGTRLTSENFAALIAGLPGLAALNLGARLQEPEICQAFFAVPAESLAVLARHPLEMLDITISPDLSEEGWESLGKLVHLKELRLTIMGRIVHLNGASRELRALKKLQRLFLSFDAGALLQDPLLVDALPELRDVALEIPSEKELFCLSRSKSLRALRVSLADSNLQTFVRAMPAFRRLETLSCRLPGQEIQEDIFSPITELSELRALELRGGMLPDVAFWQGLAKLEKLTTLRVSCDSLGWTYEKLIAILDLPRVSYFAIHHCPLMNDEHLKTISKRKQITKLTLIGSKEITDEGLRALAGGQVEYLNISDCSRITTSGLAFLSKAPSLRTCISTVNPIKTADLIELLRLYGDRDLFVPDNPQPFADIGR